MGARSEAPRRCRSARLGAVAVRVEPTVDPPDSPVYLFVSSFFSPRPPSPGATGLAFLVAKGADLTIRASATDWPSQISNEPRVQYRPVGGLTPLLYAARAGCLGCVRTMVEAGADKDRPNPDGMTPMIMALDNGAPEVAHYLLEQGANPNTWDWWGRTPLYVAVTMRGGVDSRAGRRPPASLAFIKALLEAGVNPNPQLAFKEPSRGGRDNRFRDDLLTTGATPLIRAARSCARNACTWRRNEPGSFDFSARVPTRGCSGASSTNVAP